MTTKPWHYSHTQLALWRQCKRRYYNSYVLGRKEPTTDNMAAGTWLAQNPIEASYDEEHNWVNVDDVFWESIWANFLAEFGGDDSYDSPLFSLDLAKRILAAYKANPVRGKVVEIERTYEMDFGGGIVYTSRPDFVVEECQVYDPYNPWRIEHNHRTTWDIKLKTFNQRFAGDTYYAQADLSPFDDQCLGQAILAGADSFGQIQFWLGKKDGTLIGPQYVEQSVSAILAAEWKRETAIECNEIDQWRTVNAKLGTPWPKNSAACGNFGRPCPHLAACNFGFEAAVLDNRKGKD